MNATKQTMAEALKRLLLKKPIQKITISELAAESGVSRMTFYYHFRDIYDLAEWAFRQEADKAINGYRTYGSWQKGYLAILTQVKANEPLIYHVFRSVDESEIEKYLLEMLELLVMDVVEKEAEGMVVSPAEKKNVAVFYTYALVGLSLAWVRSDMQPAPAEMVEMAAKIMQGSLRRALENFHAAKENGG